MVLLCILMQVVTLQLIFSIATLSTILQWVPLQYSIVTITTEGLNPLLGRDVIVSVCLSSFDNNELGPALYISQVTLKFCNSTIFQNNSAESGAAIYVKKNSLITMDNKSLVQFVNNTSSLRGGAIYSDLSKCINNGILFSNLSYFLTYPNHVKWKEIILRVIQWLIFHTNSPIRNHKILALQ